MNPSKPVVRIEIELCWYSDRLPIKRDSPLKFKIEQNNQLKPTVSCSRTRSWYSAFQSRLLRIGKPNHLRVIVRSHPAIIAGVLISTLNPTATAQRQSLDQVKNPIYIADSPIANESLIKLPDLIAQSNLTEAARLTDEIITDLGDRLIESETPGLYIHVRSRINTFVLNNPSLLEAYRTRKTPAAQAWLDQDEWSRVADEAWLTRPGMTASLQRAQVLIESAHFQAGTRILRELLVHPDAAALAERAADISNLAARYIPDQSARDLADQWAVRAIREPREHQQISRHDHTDQLIPVGSHRWNADRNQQTALLDGIVPGALQSTPMTVVSELELLQGQNQPGLSGANSDPVSWVAPVVSGNQLFTNDGLTISSFDRFTLRPIWRIQNAQTNDGQPGLPNYRAQLGRNIEDATTLTIVGSDLYAPVGIPRSGDEAFNSKLIKVDTDTGKTQWSVDISTLDDSLSGASIRGRVLVDEDIVLIGARTNNRRQRLISFSVVGLDSATGELRWVRHVGSAGSLPFQQAGQLAHSPTLFQGTAYWTDHIGLAFAIESATGRLHWARSLPPPDLYARFRRPFFSTNTPVVTEYGMFTLSTDGTEIFQLDLATGRTIAKRAAQPTGEVFYLLRLRDHLASVSQYRVHFYPLERFENAAGSRSSIIGGTKGIRGRVFVNGDELIVPTDTGIDVINTNQPQRQSHIDLDAVGNVVVLDGQILVADVANVSSFLSWKTASKLLASRIDQDPNAAITLAELAYRSNRTKETLDHVERARNVISGLPIDQRRTLNNQLFDVVLDMVEPNRVQSIDTQSTKPTTQASPTTDQFVLLNHLGQLARSHKQVVAQRMALGTLNNLAGKPTEAISAYQDILDQPILGASMWEGSGIAVRAGLESTRRIGDLLNTLGFAPYKQFDRLAITELALIEQSTNPDDFEQLAKRYPFSTITPNLWLNIAKIKSAQEESSASISAAIEGIDSARSASKLKVKIDQSTVDALAEYAITGMVDTNRIKDAETFSSALLRDFPRLTLRIDGQVITHDQIKLRAQSTSQLPALGSVFIRDDQPLLLTGSPITPNTRIDQGGVVMYAPQLGRLEYARAGRGVFETIWSRSSKTNETPIIPWQDEVRTLIYWPEGTSNNDSGTLEAIETTTGKTIWSINNVRVKIADKSKRIADHIARVEGIFNAPVQGPVPLNQVIVVTDGHTIVVADRIGRAMGVDLFTGKQLWKKDLPLNRVHDLDLGSGVLGLCGINVVDPDQQGDGTTSSIVVSVDPRSGQTIQVIDGFGQLPRWVRASSNANLYVATSQRIVAINTKEGAVDWVLKDNNLQESNAGWISNDQLLVLNDQSQIWGVSIDGGIRSKQSLDLRQKITQRGSVRFDEIGDNYMFSGAGGFAIFNPQHQLIAADPLKITSPIVGIARGTDRLAMIQTSSNENEDWVSNLYLLETDDARLLDSTKLRVPASLGRQPTSITSITGGVIIGYREVSIFVKTEIPVQ
jgi:outer membrane protein assembly factor BamB